ECPYKPRAAGAETKLFSLTERWTIAPDSAASFIIKLKQPTLQIKTPVQDVDYVIVTDGGENIGDDVSVALTTRAQEVTVTVTNSNTTYQATFRKFELRGSPLVGGKSSQVVAPVNSAIGNASTSTDLLKRKTLPDNDYIQTIEQATMIANLMADRAGNVLGVVTLTGVPCRFWYEPGDRVNVENTLKGYDKDIFITGINRQLGPGPVAEMTITGVEAAGFYPYTLSEYFVLGTDAPGVGKRLFY
ncbi:MAG: hypothetical protein KJ560_22115, partial [Gammaproteobacteria bacterium]|nr:hypothetical protein [Gammaproteobacteria bacterium]